LDAPLHFLILLSSLHEEGDHAQLEDELAQFTRERLNEIENSLITRFANREHLVAPAFAAHRSRDYALSIPALLLQADGIFQEFLQEPFFCSRKSTCKVREHFKKLDWPADEDAWLLALTELGSMRMNTQDLPPDTDTLNRHAVLHGLRTDWNNEVNSLKCISLMEYFASLEWIFTPEASADRVTPVG
jgi:hypothetical protein